MEYLNDIIHIFTECDISGNNKQNFGNSDDDYEDNYNVPNERPQKPSPARPPPKRPPGRGRRPTPRPDNKFRDTDADQIPSERPSRKEQPKKTQYPSFVKVEQLDETATSPPLDKASKSKYLNYFLLIYFFEICDNIIFTRSA